MGLASWLSSGLISWLVSRKLPHRAPGRAMTELAVSLGVATFAGLLATALDFGGWNEIDERAILFSLMLSLAAIALLRRSV